MIHYNDPSEKTKIALLQTFKTLKISELLRKSRIRSKNVELLAKVYDHVAHRFQKGFTMLTLGTGRMLCILLVYAT